MATAVFLGITAVLIASLFAYEEYCARQ